MECRHASLRNLCLRASRFDFGRGYQNLIPIWRKWQTRTAQARVLRSESSSLSVGTILETWQSPVECSALLRRQTRYRRVSRVRILAVSAKLGKAPGNGSQAALKAVATVCTTVGSSILLSSPMQVRQIRLAALVCKTRLPQGALHVRIVPLAPVLCYCVFAGEWNGFHTSLIS